MIVTKDIRQPLPGQRMRETTNSGELAVQAL